MARLFGFIGNRADLAGRVLVLERDALRVPSGQVTAPLSWGIGFYQGGDVLLRRRPHDDRPELDMAELAADVRSDLIVGHVRAGTLGATRTENTHPFRYREWLFAHTGTIDRYTDLRPRLLDSIPEFLRKNIRGDTDSEVFFHIVLSFLHDAGRLHDGGADARTVGAALSSTATLLEHLVGEEGGKESLALNAVVTNGELLGALHLAPTPAAPHQRMMLRVVHGAADLEAIVADDALRRVRLTDPGALRFTFIASDFDHEQSTDANAKNGDPYARLPQTWTAVPPRAIVIATRDGDPKVETL